MFGRQRRKILPSFPSEIRRLQQRCGSSPPPQPQRASGPGLTCSGTPTRTAHSRLSHNPPKRNKVKENWDINGKSRNHWPCRLQAIPLPVNPFKINSYQVPPACSKMFHLGNMLLIREGTVPGSYVDKKKHESPEEIFREYWLGIMTFSGGTRTRRNTEGTLLEVSYYQ